MFTKSISYWSFPGGLEGSMPAVEALTKAKKSGYEAIELCLSETGDISLDTTEKTAKDILNAANDTGIAISSVACGLFWGTSLTSTDPATRAKAIDITKKLIDVAAWLDAGAALVVPGAVDVFFDPNSEVVEYSQVWDWSTQAIQQLIPHAEAAKITIGVENVWNKFLVGPAELVSFIDQFNSEWVGSYFDVGNAMLVGYPEHWIRMLGNRIKRVHIKDFKRSVGTADGFVDLLSGDVNWPAVISALTDINYNSFITAEMIPTYKHYPEVLIENTSRAMDAILGR